MKNGYKVVWTDHALDELRQTFSYLEQNFSEREIQLLANKIESTLALIATQPTMYPESARSKGVRRAVILDRNTFLLFESSISNKEVQVLSALHSFETGFL